MDLLLWLEGAMSRRRRRRCLHCNELYTPDPRTADRQRYCSDPECKCASKSAAQSRWRMKRQNRAYFSGPDQVARVRQWRKANPGYWKRAPPSRDPLQDDCRAQTADEQPDTVDLTLDALQDDSPSQVLVLLGLISHLTESALQEDMAGLVRHYKSLGMDVLGKTDRTAGAGPGSRTNANDHERKTHPPSRAPAASAAAVQLDRPPAGP
jgi:hypothetical protein